MNKIIKFLFGLLAFSTQAQAIDSKQEAIAKTTTPTATQSNKTENISPREAEHMIKEQQAVIIDVRENDEWQQQRIPGAIHIPLGELKKRLGELASYKETPIITQCRSGRRSKQALSALRAAGFANSYNLDGGIVAWNKAGLTTE